MPRYLSKILIIAALLSAFCVSAQDTGETEKDTLNDDVLLEKQWTLGVQLNTNGWGVKLRRGHNITFLRQFMWEIEFSTYKSAKEIRAINPYYSDSKSYFYGKLNYLYFLRGGIGNQRIINRKPYWGGVQVSYIYYGGLSLGITKPVYLYIIYFTNPPDTYQYEIREEKYNPDKHDPDNIFGRASFLKGFDQIGLYPGVYVRGGLEFEFGTRNRRINALETGAVLDFSPFAIPVMAYNPGQQFFVTLYFSVSFGKRYNYKGE